MDVTTERHEHVLTVTVAGRVDGSNADAFAKTLRAAIERTDRAVIMVFRDLDYIDHAGLDVVAIAAKSLEAPDARLVLCEVSKPVLTLFTISGLDRLLPIYGNEEEARASLDE